MGNRQIIDRQTKENCYIQYIIGIHEDGSFYKCTNWESLCKVLNKVHYHINYTDLFGNTIQIPKDIRYEFTKAAVARYEAMGIFTT